MYVTVNYRMQIKTKTVSISEKLTVIDKSLKQECRYFWVLKSMLLIFFFKEYYFISRIKCI